MKEFINHTVAAALVTAITISCASPVFAEGSKEFNEVPKNSNESVYPAHRPYFEWRDRGQFGSPSKNIVYVYAKANETIYFGSDVTSASDKSIEAIVHPEISFNTKISSSGKDWANASIAVTLPTEDKAVAFNPEKEATDKTEIENMFLSGDKLLPGCDPEKVYLFKPIPSGAGHILTPTQEENGPNGVVAKDATTATINGYEPLSFVAPVDGTYSFRFLSKNYEYGDTPNSNFKLESRNEFAKKTEEVAAITANKDGFLRYYPDYGNDGPTNRGIVYTGLSGWSSRNGYLGFDLGEYSTSDFDKAYLRMNLVHNENSGKIHFYWLDYGDWTRVNLPSDTTVLDETKMPTHIVNENPVFTGYPYYFVGDATGLNVGDEFIVDITSQLKEYLDAGNPKQFTLAMLSEITSGRDRANTHFASIENTEYNGPQIILENEVHDTALVNSELSPVAESYTWDFSNMKSGGKYTENTIVGYYPVDADGTDYDHNYYYDLKVHATADMSSVINSGSLSIPDIHNSETGSASLTTGYLEMIPAWDGNIEITFAKDASAAQYSALSIYQPTSSSHNYNFSTGDEISVNLAVEKDKLVYIYAEYGAAAIKSIKYTMSYQPPATDRAKRDVNDPWDTSVPSLVSAWDITVADANNTAQPGRVWVDRFILNAGDYNTSIYPQFKVLTREGFLYDVKLNGIQPWAFSFYSNNRGFLFDRWSLFSNPTLAYGDENAKSSTAALQALEHSFYSFDGSSDVGPAPVRKEVDGDGNPVMNKGKQMESTILGNYIPVDSEKDITHKIFFNEPDTVALQAYTDDGRLKEIANANIEYGSILNNIVYTGLGNSADNESSDVHYGTIGIGGRFEVTISGDEANQLDALGSSSISILLDFSGYKLTPDKNGVPVPVLDNNREWQKITDITQQTKEEKNNLVSLSAAIDNDATQTKTYTLSWDGRDAYGNIVPKGEYTQVTKSFIELGMAHFPILDAEHNPNGIKIKLLNNIVGNDKADYVYYNNEAVSPKTNPDDPSAWYYKGGTPDKIGDGLNRTGGVSTDFDNAATDGAMIFKDYGDSAAIDLWSKYEIKTNATLKIGVNPIEPLKSYVSFVATNGTANVEGTPFDVSHVRYTDEINEIYNGNKGRDDIYGNTISTGFITNIITTTEGIANDRLIWEITIPAFGKFKENDLKEHASYIKIPIDDIKNEKAKLTTQADADEAEYLSYELFTGLFEDYINASDRGVDLGEEFMPDWEADAGLDSDEEPGIMDISDSAQSAEIGLYEEMYFEEIELAAVETGDYKDNDWSITVNVSPDAVMNDAEGVIVNKGNIHKINTFKISDTVTDDHVMVKVAHKIPTITGSSAISVGLVIDNLYAPAATATAKYSSSGWDSLHEITSILFGGANTDSVQALSHEEYSTSSKNKYNLEGYNDDTLNTGLLMHITFDEVDTGSGSFEATQGGTVKENGTVSYESGKNGNAVSMGYNAENYLELPDGLFNGATSASVSFWMKRDSTETRNSWPFMTTTEKTQQNQSEKYIGVLWQNGKGIIAERYYSNNQGRPTNAFFNGSYTDWNYITVNYESGLTELYVNGSLVDTRIFYANISNLFTDTAKTWIGHANWGNGEGFSGMIDDFRIYNRPLAEIEIQTLMNVK